METFMNIPVQEFDRAQAGITQTLRTGAQIYLAEYGEWVWTDLKLTGSVFHFWIETGSHVSREKHSSRVHLIVHKLGDARRSRREALATIGNCDYLGYEGKALKQGTNNLEFEDGTTFNRRR